MTENKVLGEIYPQRLHSDRDVENLLGLESCSGRRQAQRKLHKDTEGLGQGEVNVPVDRETDKSCLLHRLSGLVSEMLKQLQGWAWPRKCPVCSAGLWIHFLAHVPYKPHTHLAPPRIPAITVLISMYFQMLLCTLPQDAATELRLGHATVGTAEVPLGM